MAKTEVAYTQDREIIRKPPSDLFVFLHNTLVELKAEGKEQRVRAIGRFTKNLQKMTGTDCLAFTEVKVDFACRYLEWLQEKGMAPSTCSAELGVMRTVMKKAVEAGFLQSVPAIPKGVHYVHRPKQEDEFPPREVFERLAQLPLDNKKLALTRDMFLFAYYCGGLELVDVLGLTGVNVKDNLLQYTRRTRGRVYNVRFDGKAKAILTRYLSAAVTVLFPIHSGAKGEVVFDSIRRLVDRRLKRLGGMVGCPMLNFSMNISASQAQIPRTVCCGITSVWDRFAIVN